MVQAWDFGWNPTANLLFLPPAMRVLPTELPGVLIIEPVVHRDVRGFFLETYHAERFAQAGISEPFVQDNHSRSAKGVLRGLHAQRRKPQGKLVRAVEGEIWDVAVDARPESPTFGRWTGVTLTAADDEQLFVPHGFAHGFCTFEPNTIRACRTPNASRWPTPNGVAGSNTRSTPTISAAVWPFAISGNRGPMP